MLPACLSGASVVSRLRSSPRPSLSRHAAPRASALLPSGRRSFALFLQPWAPGLLLDECSPASGTITAVTGSALACGNARAVGSSHWVTGHLSHPCLSRKPFGSQVRDESTSSNLFSRKGQTFIIKNRIYCNRLPSTAEELKLPTPPSHFSIFESQQVFNRGCHWDPIVRGGQRVKGK